EGLQERALQRLDLEHLLQRVAAARGQLDHVQADVAGFDADVVAPTGADVVHLRSGRFAGVPDHGGTAAAGGDVDAAAEAGVAQHVVAARLGIDAVAAAGIARVAQVPVALLDVSVAAVELVQVGQAIQPGHVDPQCVADVEV